MDNQKPNPTASQPQLASRTGLGVRGMENQIRQMIDDVISDNCEQRCFEF